MKIIETGSPSPALQRLSLIIRGAVQGVGFRPFVYRLATEMHLPGWVSNTGQGVFIEVDGPPELLAQFLLRLEREIPPRAFVQSLESRVLDPAGFTEFVIRESDATGTKTVLVLPDIATCPECLREIFEPANRRYRYPFTNCTNCGPRFSIIERLPYDRPNTSMRRFGMCPLCEQEYRDPGNRRFHAQPNACPACGPRVGLWDASGAILSERDAAMRAAAEFIRTGRIVAVKGIGGFLLMVDARNDEAVRRLRERKRREEKPFALMVATVEDARKYCAVDPLEERLLASPEAPIVLLRRSASGDLIVPSVAPSNPTLGILLPYSPLHHLLLRDLAIPVVATSGNRSDEPICTDEQEALRRLKGIADAFLVHDRPIVRHVDDSVARVMLGREQVLRRARGYAPLPVPMNTGGDPTVIVAVGAHLKNAIALVNDGNAFVSQHIGDLETPEALDAFKRVVKDLQQVYEAPVARFARDRHPDYLSSRYALESGLPVTDVQHHYAHILSCMAENELLGPVLGVAWDGTGLGADGTVWGGEFLLADERSFSRYAWFRPFRLPGGDTAIKEPRRVALGMLVEAFGAEIINRTELPTLQAFDQQVSRVLLQMITKGVNAPWTSSAGRLFDGIASIIGLRQVIRHEGMAAMEMEFLLGEAGTGPALPSPVPPFDLRRTADGQIVIDWSTFVAAIMSGVHAKVGMPALSRAFHDELIETIIRIAREAGRERIVLSGGCFQNRYLTEGAVRRLREEGLRPYWHQRVPPNDGGIALGQAYAAVHASGRPPA